MEFYARSIRVLCPELLAPASRGVLDLQEKNYTNPEDRGRFGFSMSGEYRAPYKSETTFVTALLGAAAAAGLIILFLTADVFNKIVAGNASSSSFWSIVSVAVIAVLVAVIVVIFGVGIRNVKKGVLCKYTANDEMFTTTIGGDLHVIHYSEVTNVHFQPRLSRGKIRGYDVTIRINGKNESFSICSDGYLSPNATPFYIIRERLDIIRRSHGSVQENTARADTKAITKAEIERAKSGSISSMDRMAQLLGETSNMPSLSADTSAEEKTAEKVDKVMNEYSSSEMPSIGGKVRNEYPSSEMPSIGGKVRQVRDADIIIGADGREEITTAIRAQGTFYTKLNTTLTVVLAIIIAAAWYFIILFGWQLLWYLSAYLNTVQNYIVVTVLFLISIPFLLFHSVTKFHGPLHSYKADARGFYLTIQGKGSDQILYKDVLSVDYTPTKFMWGDRGYKVEILTTYGVIKFDYIFPRFNHTIPIKDMPFDVIQRNIPERNKTKTQ